MLFSAILLCLLSLTDASFVIQKMREVASPNRKSRMTAASKYASSTHGRTPINSLVRSSTYSAGGGKSSSKAGKYNKMYKNKKEPRIIYSRESQRKSTRQSRKQRDAPDWSSVNIISSIGGAGKSGLKYISSSNNKLNNVMGNTKARVASIQTPTTFLNVKQSAVGHRPLMKSMNNVTIDDFVYVSLPLNQWTQFYFSEPGQLPYSRWTFDIPANQKCNLQVVDAYCTGDRFEADRRLDNGQEVFLLSTPPVPYNPAIAEQIRLGSSVNCTPFTTDAETAWASSSWSKGQVALQPGNYKLILKSLLAPYGSGGAFVKLDCSSNPNPTPTPTPAPVPTNLCSYASSSIKYVRQSLPFPQLTVVCQSYGLKPFAATAGNIREARNVLMNCAGADSRAWIASYNGDNYGGAIGLSLHATSMSETGAITATPDTSATQGALCM